MLFHEIYGCYYSAVAEILRLAVRGELCEEQMKAAADRYAYAESFLTIVPALKGGQWQLLRGDLTTPLSHEPTLPLTELQRRWLKAIMLDPRIRLFGEELFRDDTSLDGVQPLFTQEDIVVFDKYADGDPFTDERYISVFRTLMGAIREKRQLRISYKSNKGTHREFLCVPQQLEYSEKDDKFRLYVGGCRNVSVMNVANIESVQRLERQCAWQPSHDIQPQEDSWFVMRLSDERNALERAMLHFAHYRRETERIDEKQYLVKVFYCSQDENEMVIRVLSFGEMVRVTQPPHFVELMRAKLKAQYQLGLK